ncbi:Serine/threonine-protein kinase ULK4 [Chelonia mydas]|uniref:Serine/threonine-protein kinase ULK4 n=1 Tax=Chelonia mydas TaxID=8469 RepID=M7B159_CHEMY|nr:Serine/threonine-protein kinase ULK4 [Chelonia mydas]
MFKHNNWLLMDTAKKKKSRFLLAFMEQLHTLNCHFWTQETHTDWTESHFIGLFHSSVCDVIDMNQQGNGREAGGDRLVHHICNLLIETSALYLEVDDKSNIKTANGLLLSLLDILHCMLIYTANIIRLTLQAQKSGTGGDTQAAEDLLLINKPLTDLISLLIQLLPSDDAEIYETASQCLSLLVQLYGGDNLDSMSPENMDSFAEVLKSKRDLKQQKLLLRIIKRLVSQTNITSCHPEFEFNCLSRLYYPLYNNIFETCFSPLSKRFFL